MIGSGLKKFAKEYNMKIDSGVAYGVMNGYAVTLQEGNGYKQMAISTRFPEMEAQRAFEQQVSAVNIASQFRVQQFQITPSCIVATFTDSVGTMKKLREFANWIFPLLKNYGAAMASLCNECGAPIYDGGVWMLRDGIAAAHVHEMCGNRVQQSLIQENAQRLQENDGSYATGTIGAILGSVVGAAVWAVVLMGGWVASIVGLLIGFLANTGYNLLKGKQGKGKIAILIVAVIIGVVLGTAGGTCLQVIQEMNELDVDMEYFGELMELLLEDGDVQGEIIANTLMGLLFAGLGVIGLLKQEQQKIKGESVKFLK